MRIIILGTVLAVSTLIACNDKPVTEGNKALIVAADTAKVKYQCPMKCQGDTAYTTAGKCPVCKMDLEKK